MANSVEESIKLEIAASRATLERLQADEATLAVIGKVVDECLECLRRGGKLMFVGNGGSAADAQHLAGELVSRFNFDRPALAGIALTTDTSVLTAIGNDYGYEHVFARQVRAIGLPGDVLFGITTSGRSSNILAAFHAAEECGITTVGLTGERGAELRNACRHCIVAPAQDTPKVQEAHIVIGHLICSIVERRYFGR